MYNINNHPNKKKGLLSVKKLAENCIEISNNAIIRLVLENITHDSRAIREHTSSIQKGL